MTLGSQYNTLPAHPRHVSPAADSYRARFNRPPALDDKGMLHGQVLAAFKGAARYMGLRGNIFLDAGNSFLTRQSITLNGLQYAYGIGLFWKSPFGPINVDIAKPINRRPNDQHTVFDFGAGAPL